MTNLVSKRLKLVQKGYEQYSGPIGEYEFVDGVSVELIPLNARDRLSAAFQMSEINEDDTEVAAGVANRLVLDRANVIESTEPLARMTEEEKVEENIRALIGGEIVKPIYSKEALEAVAAESGIAGVRALASIWDVRSKSIPDLISLIAKAQDSYAAERTDELVKNGASREEALLLFTPKETVPAEALVEDVKSVVAAETAIQIAAAAGDLAEAINAGQAE